MDTSLPVTSSSFFLEKESEINPLTLKTDLNYLIQFAKEKNLPPSVFQKGDNENTYCLTLNYKISQITKSPIKGLLSELCYRINQWELRCQSVFVRLETSFNAVPDWPIESTTNSTFIFWTNIEDWKLEICNKNISFKDKPNHFYNGSNLSYRYPAVPLSSCPASQQPYRLFIQFD